MKFTIDTPSEPTVSFSLVSVDNQVHVLATDSFGESWTLATLGEEGIRICADVPAHLGMDVDDDGELIVSFDTDENEEF